MNREDIMAMARQVGYPIQHEEWRKATEEFAALVEAKAVAAERNKLAAWMMAQGYATGHGDTIEDLLAELEWQIKERAGAEREACAKLMESQWDWVSKNAAAAAIRARGQA